MLNKVKQFIAEKHLLKADCLYLVALSGGADSVALLLVLKELGYSIEAVHCNFHLRGEESLRDEQYCKGLCERENIPLHIAHFDTKEYADLHKVSIEMAARDLRYKYFFQLKDDLQAAAICVGHHKEDSVETILINLLRGTGLSGMMGISPDANSIIRPLLSVSRQEIEQYLEERKVNYVTDSTNMIDDVVRNKIRLNIIPLLKEINPSVNDAILTTAQHLTDANIILQDSLEKTVKKGVLQSGESIKIDLSVVKSFPVPTYFLFHVLKPLGFTTTQIEEIGRHTDGQTGQIWTSTTHELTHDRGFIYVYQRQKEGRSKLVLPEKGRYVFDDKCSVRLSETDIREEEGTVFSRNPLVADLDASLVRFPLTLRCTQEGDRFVPLGMQGSQLVSNFLTNLKRNRFEKRDQMVLVDAADEIVWVVGLRINDRFKITPKTTDRLRIELLQSASSL